MSPYAVFSGNPILHSDPNGDTIRVKGFVTKWNSDGNPVELADQVNAQKLWDEMLDYLRLNNLAADADLLINSTNNYDLYFYTHAHARVGGPAFKPYFDGNRLTYSGTPSLFLSPSYGLLTDNGYLMSPLEIAIHELAHGGDHERNPCLAWLNSFRGTSKQYRRMSEETVIKNKEQNAARTFGMPWNQVTRTNHEGTLKRVLNWWPGDLFKSPKERGETTQKEKAPNSNSSKGSSGGGGDSGPVNIDIGGTIQTYGGK